MHSWKQKFFRNSDKFRIELQKTAICKYIHVFMSWFNPSWQLSTSQLLAYCTSVGWGRESER